MMQLRPLLGQSENAFDHDVQLYVEGQDGSLDPTILDALFVGKRVLVQAIGRCNSVECVAEAFKNKDHRGAFFLVDRDYHHQGEVLDWKRFRNGETNLIIWRKKELEFGCGQWLNMMSGKIIFRYLLNSAGLFPTTLPETGKSGRAKMNRVAQRLLKPSNRLPQDFDELREMVIRRADDLINNPNT